MKIESVSIRDIGQIKEIRSSIVKIKGLSNCMVGQLIKFSDNTKGFVMGFNEDEVLVLFLGGVYNIKAGDRVSSEAESFKLPVGDNFLGRIVNTLCEPLDGKGPVLEEGFADIFRDAPSVLERIPIDQMFETGIRVIDSSFPIGKGQRELIIGDRMTGKTTLAVDIILNQKDRDIICIYCCIGRDYSSFEKIVGIFKERGALEYMIFVSALGSSSIGEQYLAPYTAATLADHFMYAGKDVCVVFDDLTKHAWAYRELSLLLERSSGREAYPGDIFYLHAQIMERAARLCLASGGGSMTFFPIADTLQGDIAGFIPTNLISMTDGQIYLNSTLFAEGFKPAVDLGLSVSRIGNKVQPKFMRSLTKELGLHYLQYRELLKAIKLRAAVSEDIHKNIRHGEKIERVFIQEKNNPSSIGEQLLLYYALGQGILDELSEEECEDFKANIFGFLKRNLPDVARKFEAAQEPSAAQLEELNECLIRFFKENYSTGF